MAGLIAICLCLTVTILELMKLKREAKMEAAQKEEAAKNGSVRHNQVRALPASCFMVLPEQLERPVSALASMQQ